MKITVRGVEIEVTKHRNRASNHEWRLTIDTAEAPGLSDGPSLVDAKEALSDVRGYIEDGVGSEDIEPVLTTRPGPRAVTFDYGTKPERDTVAKRVEFASAMNKFE